MSEQLKEKFLNYGVDQQSGFWGFSSKPKDYAQVFKNLKRLEAELGRLPDDYRTSILQRCYRDLSGQDPKALFKLSPSVLDDLSILDVQDYPRYLFYRYRYEVFPVTREVDTFPPCLQIEPVSSCNFRCVFCFQIDQQYSGDGSEHMGSMDFDLFKSIVDEAEGKCDAVTLASRGEPLMHRDIGKMLAYLKNKFLAVKINTNASYLTEELSHEILKCHVRTLVFSVDAAEEPLYSKLRVGGSLKDVYANIKRFHEIKKRDYPHSKLITRISGVKVSGKQSLDAMQNLWGGLVDQVAFVDFTPWSSTYTKEENDIKHPCQDLWVRSFVWWDGRMNPCDKDYKTTLLNKNFEDGGISHIWNSPEYNDLRKLHMDKRRKDVSPCNRCTFY